MNVDVEVWNWNGGSGSVELPNWNGGLEVEPRVRIWNWEGKEPRSLGPRIGLGFADLGIIWELVLFCFSLRVLDLVF